MAWYMERQLLLNTVLLGAMLSPISGFSQTSWHFTCGHDRSQDDIVVSHWILPPWIRSIQR